MSGDCRLQHGPLEQRIIIPYQCSEPQPELSCTFCRAWLIAYCCHSDSSPRKPPWTLKTVRQVCCRWRSRWMFLFPVVTVQSAAEEQRWISSPAWVYLPGEPGSACNCWRGTEKVLLINTAETRWYRCEEQSWEPEPAPAAKAFPCCRVQSRGIREMLSLSNCFNTRTRTKLSEVRNVTVFLVQLCPHAGAKGSDLSPGMLVPPTQPREGPWTVNKGVSTAVVFLLWVPLQTETFCQRNQLIQVLRHFTYPNPLLFIFRVVVNGNPSPVFSNKTQQKFIVLDAATTAFGRMVTLVVNISFVLLHPAVHRQKRGSSIKE